MSEKIGLWGFLTQTGLCSHRRRLEAWKFRFKKRDCTIHVAKLKVLISCAVTELCLVFFRQNSGTAGILLDFCFVLDKT